MDMPVNFLPWRQTRRKATLRLWSMMFGGALVLITALEQMLRSNASFLLIHTGATQQDAKGRWQFEYQLQRRDDNEHVL